MLLSNLVFSISRPMAINLDTVIDHRVGKTCQHFPSTDEKGKWCFLKWPLMNSKMPNWKVLFCCQFLSGDKCQFSFRNSLIFLLLNTVRACKFHVVPWYADWRRFFDKVNILLDLLSRKKTPYCITGNPLKYGLKLHNHWNISKGKQSHGSIG